MSGVERSATNGAARERMNCAGQPGTGGVEGRAAGGAVRRAAGGAEPRAGGQTTDKLAEIAHSERAGVYLVGVTGELDVSNVGALERAAYEMSNEALGLVLDLSAATYIDSATIGLLFKLRAYLARRGQALRVVCTPGSSAQRVLELTGFDRELPPAEDRDGAIAAIWQEVPLREGVALEDERLGEGVALEDEQLGEGRGS
jgi:anti-anti-sigma factor